ncbi:embryonic polarity protein dorsal-like isoform X2 [Zootermopsis nevadensis]|uniref:embryonic polarity protein dorsal-like isoform X2 n=1 Tax=Zootermopsis nevadensis TaxID=136037 RepID=UPI000B8E50CA|nr:embryonic polarity protein dorsal-like isoform X2 [Zootermopsis nevadensis]
MAGQDSLNISDVKAIPKHFIRKLSESSCTVAGDKQIIQLCEKVAKQDIQIHFYEERDGNILWKKISVFWGDYPDDAGSMTYETLVNIDQTTQHNNPEDKSSYSPL